MNEALLGRIAELRERARVGKATVVEVDRLLADVEAALKTQDDPIVRVRDTMTYSEINAIQAVADELGDDSGAVVSSRIADQAGLSRSVMVTAIRKLAGAGIIEAHNMGMKGTVIKGLIPGWREKFKAVA